MLEPPLPAVSSSRRTLRLIAGGTAAVALIWRVLLARVYFGSWPDENRIGVVVWFRDPWFETRSKAPSLGGAETIDLGVVVLMPVGWTWYPAPDWTP